MTTVTQSTNKAADQTLEPGPSTSARLTVAATPISQWAVSMLRQRIRGDVLTDADEAYDAARHVWNARIDRKPGVIVRCADASDVRVAIILRAT